MSEEEVKRVIKRDAKGRIMKGQVLNPYGGPQVLTTILSNAIEQNKENLRLLILDYLNRPKSSLEEEARNPDLEMVKVQVISIMERIANDGDAVKFKQLIEIALGKMPEDKEDFPLDPEEKLIILSYRKHKKENERISVTTSQTVSGEDNEGS